MGQISLTGALTGGPPSASSYAVPSSTFNLSLFFQGGTRQYQSATGILQRTINSPNAFAALSGIGAANDVVKADFFIINSAGPVDVQVVADDGNGGSTTQVISCSGGPTMISARAEKLITAIGVKGTAQIEYFASGPQ